MSNVVRIAEPVWRQAADQHQRRIRDLLRDGLTPVGHALNSGSRRARIDDGWTALDPLNPVYNFLIEYYGLKGRKGPRRLARWSPTFTELSGVLLQGAGEGDLGDLLHMRGAVMDDDGILYSPALFFGRGDNSRRPEAQRAATSYLWYQAILQQTLAAEPVLHCHGLHEWAMQYHPEGAPPPPSGRYQRHLPLRVSRSVINSTVERKGIRCTHVDALRFFAPAAGPLNYHGAVLERTDQLRLEQPACVHAHMDLLKIALRLQPFCGADLLAQVLAIALEARRLDVAASPYDASAYGVGVVAVEHASGRAEYRRQQAALMAQAEVVRRELLAAYNVLLASAFDEDVLVSAVGLPQAERFAKAEPGGLPWRQNLIESS